MILVKNWIILECFVLDKILKGNVFVKDKQLILPYIFDFWQVAKLGFSLKIEKLKIFLFGQKMSKHLLGNVLYEKQAILDYKKVDF